ncbi:MAG: 5'/3'-nucleotidase SurE [Oscillochloris sp.]|nr:5'/3'-nucleotidase SurE [Oscillochloris sp.]
MHILVTNDDGIDSPGLWVLAAALHESRLGHVTIIAPESEQSGAGMSLPMRADYAIRPAPPLDPAYAAIPAFALSGSPVGCVSAGMLAGVCAPADVVVSGINRGLNCGTNVLLSGTVGAAMIAALWGLPAMAVSLQLSGNGLMPWFTAAWAAVRAFPLLAHLRDHAPVVLNVNVPYLHSIQELRGFRQTRLSDFFYGNYVAMPIVAQDADERRQMRFTFLRDRVPDFPATSDDGAVRAGYVSLTPLSPLIDRADLDLQPALAASGIA